MKEIERGIVVRSLWDKSKRGVVKYYTDIDKSAGHIPILWHTGETTMEIWKCDVEPCEEL